MSSPSFADSYLGKLRKIVGSRLIMQPGTVVVILNEKNEVLLQHRRDFDNWGLPGGAPEPGETISEAIRREACEETGLKLEELIPFGFASDPSYQQFKYPGGDEVHSYCLLFYCARYSGELDCCLEEAHGLKFYGLDSLPDKLFAPHKRGLEAFSNYRQSKLFQMI